MKRLFLALLLLVVPSLSNAQGNVFTYPSSTFSGTYVGTGNFDSICLDSTNKDTCLVRKSANVLTTPGIDFNVNSSTAGFIKNSFGGAQITFVNSSILRLYSNVSSGIGYDYSLKTVNGSANQIGFTPITATIFAFEGDLQLGTDAVSATARTIRGKGSRPGTDTDTVGGNLTITSGLGTGTAASTSLIFQTPVEGSTGTTIQGTSDRFRIVGAVKSVTDASATSVLAWTLASNSTAGGLVNYCVEATNGTDYQEVCGTVAVACVNKAATITGNTSILGTEARITSTGTMTTAWGLAAGTCTLQLTADTSLSPSAGYPRVRYSFFNNGTQAVTPQ